MTTLRAAVQSCSATEEGVLKCSQVPGMKSCIPHARPTFPLVQHFRMAHTVDKHKGVCKYTVINSSQLRSHASQHQSACARPQRAIYRYPDGDMPLVRGTRAAVCRADTLCMLQSCYCSRHRNHDVYRFVFLTDEGIQRLDGCECPGGLHKFCRLGCLCSREPRRWRRRMLEGGTPYNIKVFIP